MRLQKDIEIWKAALKTAEEQYGACRVRLDALDAERSEIVEEMRRLEHAMDGMRPFITEHPLDELNQFLEEFTPEPDVAGLGLADACRKMLQEADRYMTPKEIRDVLASSNYDLTQHPNPLASIHSVLKRLVQSGDVLRMADSRGVIYKWNTSDFKHSPLKWIGQRRLPRVPTQADAVEAARESNMKRELERLAKNLPTVPEEPK